MPEQIPLEDLRVQTAPVATAEAGEATAAAPAQAVAGQSATDAAAATATGYNAATGEIDPTTMTAAGQMTAITGMDSPLMRRAAQEGMLQAARRGLQNSSFAAGAATGAMVDRATPLAQQDAATYFNNLRANLDAMNRASEVSTGRETDVSLANARAMNEQAALETSVNLANMQEQNRMSMLQAELDQQVSLENARQANAFEMEVMRTNAELNRQFLAGTQAIDLADVQGRYQQLISSNQAASTLYSSYLQSIGQAMANDKVTPDRIAGYINTMVSQLEGGLDLIDAINTLDLGGVGITGAAATGAGGQATTVPTDATGTPETPTTSFTEPNWTLDGFNLQDSTGQWTLESWNRYLTTGEVPASLQ